MSARKTFSAGLLAFCGCAQADYLAELQAQARELNLAQHPRWQALLHYRPDVLGSGVTSRVDSPGFFASPQGKTDPQAELEATLASFFGNTEREGEPAQCRTPARYEWLRSLLRFDPNRLTEQSCERLDKWLAAIDPGSAGLVFASSSLGSPATMFGHTLMKLDVRYRGPDQKLLSNAINYAAVYDESDAGMLYAMRGIGGGYVGVFSMGPYYEKVNEYARIESRDLWEYPLTLDADDIHRLVLHLWEMREVEFDYYFFDENCSYQLLALIHSARPDLGLLEGFPQPIGPHVIPLDTVRALQKSGVLGEPLYRPALANRLKYALAQLAADEYDWVLDYARDRASFDDAVLRQASPARRAALLEAAHDYLYYQFREEIIERKLGLPRAQAALRERSKLTARSDLAELPRPRHSPDQGHRSNRVSLGLRKDRHDSALVLRTRDALHDLLDPPAGYLSGGQIEFLNLGLLLHEDGLRVLDFKAVGVQSVAVWDSAFKPWSWFASGGARRYGAQSLVAKPQGSLGFYTEAGAGITLAAGSNVQFFAYGETQIDANPDLRDSHSLALGPRGGVTLRLGNWLSHLTEAQWLNPVAGGGERQAIFRSALQWHWGRALGLRVGYQQLRSVGVDTRSGDILLNYYF